MSSQQPKAPLVQPARIVRLASTPAPYEAESFDSWFARLAGSHFTNRKKAYGGTPVRDQAARAATHDTRYRYSVIAIDLLSQRTGWPRHQFEAMLEIPRNRNVALRNVKGSLYCPACWESDLKTGSRHQRREWDDPWRSMCEMHQTPLLQSPVSLEKLLCSSPPVNPKWLAVEVAACPLSLCIDMTCAQRLIRAVNKKRPQSDADQLRGRILKELLLLAGTEFHGGSLANWSFGTNRNRGLTRNRSLCWRDIRGNPRKDEVKIPAGNLATWRHSLRIATLLLLAMDERPEFRRQDDVAVCARLLYAGPETNFAWAFNRVRRQWPDEYRSRWVRAFGWLDERDPVMWARSHVLGAPTDTTRA